MANSRFVDTRLTPQNLRALWDAIFTAQQGLAAANATIQQQAATIAAQQTQLAQQQTQVQQALITAGKATSQTSQSNPPSGGGGSTPSHDSQYNVVVAVIADLLAHGEDLSGPCGSFAVVNEVVKWLRPSQPDVGIINKPSGTNCNGYSIDAIMYLDGAVYDLLIDADNAPPTGASPQWSYAGQRPASDWRDPV